MTPIIHILGIFQVRRGPGYLVIMVEYRVDLESAKAAISDKPGIFQLQPSSEIGTWNLEVRRIQTEHPYTR